MKSTQLDKSILELLRVNKSGLALCDMARMLNKLPPNLYRRLQKLMKYGLVTKVRSTNTLYRLKLKENPIVYFKVQCPKCGGISLADYRQCTKVCPNNQCLSKNGN